MTQKERDSERLKTLLEPVQELWDSGQLLVAGADEVGRGPLAGPVMAACVVMPKEPLLPGIYDSKRVSAKKRERLAEAIKETAAAFGIGIASPEEIDELNIREATRKAFERSIDAMVQSLGRYPDHLFTDSVQLDLPFPVTPMVRADQKVYAVAAASIVAKVARDRLMVETYAEQYPEYGFERHKGYGTEEHRRAIIEHGATAIHRQSFLVNRETWKERLQGP